MRAFRALPMLPFTQAQFFAVFGAYNTALWPAGVAAYGMALGAMAVVAAGSPATAWRAVATVLSALWLWTGIAYHGIYFSAVNSAAPAFAAAFVLQGAMLGWLGLRSVPTPTRIAGRARVVGWAMVVYATAIYPLLVRMSGHAWPAAPVFGVTPCPLVIFTYGALLLVPVAVPWPVLVVPALWSVIGGSAAILLDVAPDWMLPIAGAAGTMLLLRRRRQREIAPG